MDVVWAAILIVWAVSVLGAGMALFVTWLRRRRRPSVAHEPRDEPAPIIELERGRLQELAAELDETYESVDHERLPLDERFRDAVSRLSMPAVAVETVIKAARDTNPYIAAVGLAALARRSDVPPKWTDWAIRALRRVPTELEPFLYAALVEHAAYPAIGPALSQISEGISWGYLAQFIHDRRTKGEVVDTETFEHNVAISLVETIASFIDEYEDQLGEGFRASFEKWQSTTVDLDFLKLFARVWERPFDDPPTSLVGRRRELVELIGDALAQKPPRSVLLVGEHGVGKTAIARAALEGLDRGVLVFEAGAAQVNAGAVYIGELEGRIKQIVDNLKDHEVVWVFPDFEEALYSGQHSRSPMGMLDALLPPVEAGELTLLAEITPSALERLHANRPQAMSAFEALRVRPLDHEESISVARHALEHDGLDVSAGDDVLAEACELANEFLPGIAAPGNVLRLVKATAAEAAEGGKAEFVTTDVLATLAASSGLPLAILDPTTELDLAQVRSFFSSRVLGQSEAVDCLVERIAMIKAGLTDPTRPLGVFLFVGPTGTGKTEIAKALAELLFGSPARLVRLDMSEFQTPDSLDRLLSDSSIDAQAAALVSSVRRDPFAVVLLDEFEKAATPIWDLFLQVFDDGRLTDLQGRVVDFRHSVIVITSNIGSAIARDAAIGFTGTVDVFRPEQVEKELRAAFRPEFLNRIDRIVVFRPFEREQMRGLLDKELADVLARRGLRSRPWALEIDDSAYEFIIERGFSATLGARPLKRAVERYLLAPLAEAIVERAVPEGDQFLFVTAVGGEGVAVEFIDPDAADGADQPPRERAADEATTALDLRDLALSPRGDERATAFLLAELRRISTAIRGDDLQDRKQAALAAINEPGFWEEDTRFRTLAEAEYLDRLQAALRTAESLGERLAGSAPANGRAGELLGLLSERLYVLDCAITGIAEGDPMEVFVRIRPTTDTDAEAGAAFVELLTTMYLHWAERRGMRIERLDADPGEEVLAVSGLGCGTILAREAGLHVFERSEERESGGRATDRISAFVHVAPWEPGPRAPRGELVDRARATLESTPMVTAVVRRYRPEPTPLVRDAVRRYRTGRLDRVLAGDFDLF